MSFTNPAFDYTARSFHAGFLDAPEPDALPLGATPDAKNCLFASKQRDPLRATLDKRTGCRMLTTSKVDGTAGFDGLCEFRRVGQSTGTLVAVLNGKVWYWDNVSAMVQVGVTAPFAVGTKVTFDVQRNLLFIMDGLTTRCWDGVLGSDLFTPGQIAPTAAGALTTAAGPGVTGTYQGFQVWYDSTHDHETSPSALTAEVVFANQQRTWAKPAGAPGANYDKWRIYCRRVDTFEAQYKRVAEVAFATVSHTESMTDALRNLAALSPLPVSNNPPPLTFEFQIEHQGYRLGVIKNDDQVYVSKLGDPQSQHPSDIIGVARGAGGELRSAMKLDTVAVVQKVARTYRLSGDRMPFTPKEIVGSYGNTGPRSAVAAGSLLYAWDENKGPYRTDLGSMWDPIANGRISNIVAATPKTAAREIECVYIDDLDAVGWSIPQGSSTRRRTLIFWDLQTESWLPPITGLEYAALCMFIDSAGSANLYVGDYWGRLYQYFTDQVEGVPSGTLIARVLSSTSGTVTCDNALAMDSDGEFDVGAAVAFYTTGGGLAGLPVLHIDGNDNFQWRRIQSNTGSVLTLDTTNDSPWDNLPQAGDRIVVGGIDWYWRTAIIDFGDPFTKKKGQRAEVQLRPGSSALKLCLRGFKEGYDSREFSRDFISRSGGGLWGSGLWGSMMWGGGNADALKTRLKFTFFGLGLEVSNPYPNAPVGLLGVRLTADRLGARLRRSGKEVA